MNRLAILAFALTLPLVGCSKSAPAASGPASTSAASTQAAAVEAAPEKAPETAGLPDRDPALAKKLVSEGAVFIDVRSKEAFEERHLEGASTIPVEELEGRLAEVDKLAGGDKNKPVVLYCRSGGRAGKAKEMLLKAGYTKVTNMGGISDWPAKK